MGRRPVNAVAVRRARGPLPLTVLASILPNPPCFNSAAEEAALGKHPPTSEGERSGYGCQRQHHAEVRFTLGLFVQNDCFRQIKKKKKVPKNVCKTISPNEEVKETKTMTQTKKGSGDAK